MKLNIKKPKRVDKKWGYELHLFNGSFCGKVLHFYTNASLSAHCHVEKAEAFYCAFGRFALTYIDPSTAERFTESFTQGDSVFIPQGCIHKLYCFEEGEIFEVSSHDDPNDSFRIEASTGPDETTKIN